jgi:hypothetical protein
MTPLFVDKNKTLIIRMISFSWGNENYEIKSSHLPHIFGDPG